MRNKLFHFRRCFAVLSLAVATIFNFGSCGSDNDELSVDVILSKETTPVDFNFSGFSYYYGSDNILFDYSGNNFVGSDTISKSSCTLNLRQGKHKLIWINGLWPTYSEWNEDWGEKNRSGVYFNPLKKTITNYYTDGNTSHIIVFCEKNLEVSPYLLPAQQIKYEHLTCALQIEVTDNAKWLTSQTDSKGRITGVPSVRSISLDNKKYSLNDIRMPVDSIRRYENYIMLCPADGLDDIQPVAEISDVNGNPMPTTQLPKFSLRRGQRTILRGPLLSGSTSDWIVTMEAYKD